MIRFEAWWLAPLLLLVPALVLLHAHAFRRRRAALAVLVERELAHRVLPRVPERRRRWRAACLVGAVAAFAVALMQPQWGDGGKGLPLRGRDLIVVLDVSLSMLAEDAAPSRLARAKAAARSLAEAIRGEGGHRLGLLTFAGRADVQSPLSRDYDLFLERLAAARVEDVAQRGSALGSAMLQAARMFGEPAPAYTDLILLTDGEDHGGQALDAARALANQGYSIHAVGIGDPDRAVPVPVAGANGETSRLVYRGEEVRTRMRRGTLTAIAEAGGGAYVGAESGGVSLAALYRDHIEGRPRRELESSADRQLGHRFQIFVLAAILLLGAEMMIREPEGEPT